ncbi:uncharacterized protein CMU_033900 [Cryptosporidium muris RN66]|uniref:GOLD domain-containing protein n=1 Tax=Cryptosporidium muris (strain RN66) TaxID=441375 RepID=B6AFL4_CRYMR|nr:uncharacterized protein CMU_033900 [Cryptosporidium muris RN66]EEA07005.1 hypothetical protein, conserved [Cryptosporidium muris RN66]|eukprot:XP_002141354.1 hypothetical protein [Cryptosporidium muris RN66]
MLPNNKHILPSYFVLIITVLNLVTGQTNALFFKLPPSSTECIIFHARLSDHITGSYEVEGIDGSVRVYIADIQFGERKLFDNIKKTGHFSITIPSSSNYELCFKSLMGSIAQTISFNFRNRSLISASNLMTSSDSKRLQDSIEKFYEKISLASEQQSYSLTRRDYHMKGRFGIK